jgi:hypothetical protein
MNFIIPNYDQPEPAIEGFIQVGDLEILYNWASKYDTVLEIGAWKGRSTHALASGCKGNVITVDHFQGSADQLGYGPPVEMLEQTPYGGYHEKHKEAKTTDIYGVFIENTKKLKNLSVLRMDSIKAAALFKPQSIDMIFIDGEHSYEGFRADLVAWLPICKKFLCGHDLLLPGVWDVLQQSKLPYKTGAEMYRKKETPGFISLEGNLEGSADLWYVEMDAVRQKLAVAA